MARMRWLTAAMIVVTAAGVWAETAAAPSLLLQKGLYAEQTEGDLDKAIGLYEQVVEQTAESQRLGAQATYQLGMCYLKKGDEDKATDYFRQVQAKYPQQQSWRDKARAELVKLTPPVPEDVVFALLPETVVKYLGAEYGAISARAGTKNLYSNSHIYYVDEDFHMAKGGMGYYHNWTGQPVTGRVRLSGTSYPNQSHYDVTGNRLDTDIVPDETRDGFYQIYWTPSEPLAAGAFLYYGWCMHGKHELKALPGGDDYVLVMQNKFGQRVVETFFLVLPADLEIVGGASGATLQRHIDGYDVYAWEEEVPGNTNHVKQVTLRQREGGPRADVPRVISSTPAPFTNDVDPELDTLSVTFDRPMSRQGYSWCQVMWPYPETDGAPWFSDDGRTCYLKVKLEPGTAYLVGNNTPPYVGFKSIEGAAAQPYAIAFATRNADGEPTAISAGLRAKAEEIMRMSAPSTAQELTLEPAPWVDGEVMELRLKRPGGNEYGTLIWSADRGKVGQSDTWKIVSHTYVTDAGGLNQYTFVEAEQESLVPVTGRTVNWGGDYAAEYRDGVVNLVMKTAAGGTAEQDTPLDKTHFDNEQALYLIRRMPLTEGYRGRFPIFTVQGGMRVECRISVVDRQALTVAAGTYDCFKMDLAVYLGETRTLQHTLWFSADEHKYLVKYDVGGAATMELARVWQRQKGMPLTYDAAQDGFSVTVPEDWRTYRHDKTVQLLAPEAKAWSIFTFQPRGDDPDSASALTITQADSKKMQEFFKNYVIDEESWRELTVGGLEAAQFVATYDDAGTNLAKFAEPVRMVEYRTYIVNETTVYWFVFRVKEALFTELRSILDGIIAGTRFSEPTDGKDAALSSEDLAAEGWQLWGKGKLAEAEAKFQAAVDLNATNENAWQGLGWAQSNQGKKLNAAASFERCIALNPKNPAALNGLGWIAHGMGKMDEAVDWWSKAVEAQPGATAALNGLTQVHMERGEYDKAAEYYQLWLKVEPQNSDVQEGFERALEKRPLVSADDVEDLICQMGEREDVPFTALNKLIKIGEPAVEPLIGEMATTYNWQIPKALGAIGDKRAVRPMIERWPAVDTSPMKDVIGEALERITGVQRHGVDLAGAQRLGNDREAWEAWWSEVGPWYTPENTLRGFMAAAKKLDVDEAMRYVAPESHDYADIKEVLEDEGNPFNIIFRHMGDEPIEIVELAIQDNMATATWQITLGEDFTVKGKTMKAGETFDLDGGLRLYGGKWLITGI